MSVMESGPPSSLSGEGEGKGKEQDFLGGGEGKFGRRTNARRKAEIHSGSMGSLVMEGGRESREGEMGGRVT